MPLLLASEFEKCWPAMAPLLRDMALPNKNAVLIPTAGIAEGFMPAYETNVKPLEEAGFTVTLFDIAGKPEAAIEQALSQASVIYVSGGNSFFLLEHMKKGGFEKILRRRLEQGAVYIGSSAGSIVCAPDIAYIAPMDAPDKALGLPDTKGLGLVQLALVPHLDGRSEDMARAAQRCLTYQGPHPLLALYDSQILFVEGKILRVLDAKANP